MKNKCIFLDEEIHKTLKMKALLKGISMKALLKMLIMEEVQNESK